MSTLRTYSDVLQLRTETIRALLSTDQGIAWAVKMFFVVLLVAGLGTWFGLTIISRQMTLVEKIDTGVAAAQRTSNAITNAVAGLARGDTSQVPELVVGAVQEQVAPVLGQLQGALQGLAGSSPRVQQLLQQERITVEQVSQAIDEVEISAEQLSQLVDRANATSAEVDSLLQKAGITRAELDQARATLSAAAGTAMAELQPLIARIGMTEDQLRGLLDQLSATPEQLNQLLKGLSVKPAELGDQLAEAGVTTAELDGLVGTVRTAAENAQPPLGPRPSSAVRLGGEWLSTPMVFMADWFLFILVLMLVAKALGGRATLPQHLAAAALAAAPAFLLIGSFIPPLAAGMSLSLALAIRSLGRVLGLIGIVWCVVVLVKTMATAHGFSLWRSTGAIVLTALGMFVLLPLLGLWVAGFLVF
jgi:hypothetical protein